MQRKKSSFKTSKRASGTQGSKQSASQLPPENRYFNLAMLGVFCVVVFLASSYKITGDDDFFWHLATGRYIVENRVVPDRDVFGFTTSNVEWIPFEWGWDVLTYGLFKLGGYDVILVFRSLMFSLIFLLYYLVLRKFKVNSVISLLLLFMLLVSVMDRLSPRPHIITYLFFVLLLNILVSFKYLEREKYIKKLYYLPLIFLIWGNVHMGVLAGGLFLFVFTAAELVIFRFPKKFSTQEVKPLKKEHLKRLLILSVVSALVLMLNPHGLQTYIYAYSHTKMKLLETINEWRSPFTSQMDFGFIITLYKAYLFSGLLIVLYSYLKKDITFFLVTAAFAVYSVRAIRLTVDYEIIITFFLAVSLNFFVSKIKPSNKPSLFLLYGSPVKAVLITAMIYLITLIPSNSIYSTLRYYRVFGWGINDEFIPVQLFDFMKENNISGKPYNHFGTGGYLVWTFPGQKNFIDSRNLNDELFNIYNDIMRKAPGFEQMLDKYEFDYAIYLDPDLIRRPNDLQRTVVSYFVRNPGWKLVFWDDKSMLFLKDIPGFAEVISKYEYRVMNPYVALFSVAEFEKLAKNDPARTKEEAKRKKLTEPGGFLFRGMNEMVTKIIGGF